jgi:uncharacterized membrane protein YphA (DoxX/SURF4 family)
LDKRRDFLLLFFRLVLGGLFLLASIDKILYPGDFYKLLAAYDLLPVALTGIAAGMLPWIELIVGLCLISGVAVRSSALLAVLLLLCFLIALTINYFRGKYIDCGCYTVLFRFFGLEEKISLFTIFRDLVIWLIAVIVFLYDQGRWGLGRWLSRIMNKGPMVNYSPAQNRKT